MFSADTNGTKDIVIKDTTNEAVVAATKGYDGSPADSYSNICAIAADGTFASYHSNAANLVSDDNNAKIDVFVYKVATDSIQLISRSSDGTIGDNHSYSASSHDGRHFVFRSLASNLVPGDNNGKYDIFLKDIQDGSVERLSIDSDEAQSNHDSLNAHLTPDRRYVLFDSTATNLVASDTNAVDDVFLRDRTLGTTERISIADDESEANGASSGVGVSADGRYIIFLSSASNLVSGDSNASKDFFIRDRTLGTTVRINPTHDGNEINAGITSGATTPDLRYLVFLTSATNIVAVDTNAKSDVFRFDRVSGATTMVSSALDGTQGNGTPGGINISDDGQHVIFQSNANNLLPGDSNAAEDAFVYSFNSSN
jgi:hypothetical protein